MATAKIEPHMVMADAQGNIYDDPDLLMVCRRGEEWGTPRPDELMPLPEESELFLLPGRRAVGLNPETGEIECTEDLAVAAFAAPAHTLSAHPAYTSDADAPLLPLFAYGAVGFAKGRFYICARKVDADQRQEFRHIPRSRIEKNVRALLRQFPKNRLVGHILEDCVMKYDCPAARNFALGRFEAPLPSSRTCNARCVGCISEQDKDSPINVTPQCRLTFTPNAEHDISLDFERGRQAYNNDDCQLGTLDGKAGGSATDGCNRDAPTRANGYKDELRFERDQFALSHTGRLGFGTLDSSLTHSTTETIGRTIPGTVGRPYSGYPSIVGGDDRTLKSTDLVLDSKLVMPLGEAHMFTLGGQYWDAKVEDGIATEEFQQSSWALFAEDEWRLRQDLALTLGGRYEDHEAFGGHFSPRAYLVWNTTDSWTLKGGVSQGYKTPTLNQLHDGINGVSGQGQILTIGSPDLDPETSTNTEFGVYYDNLADFNANLTLFHTRFKDKIDSGTPIPNCNWPDAPNQAGCIDMGSSFLQENFAQQVNIGKARTQGVELAGRWAFAPALSASLNYTYTDSEQLSGDDKGAPLTNTPRHMANLRLDWQASERLKLWLKGEYHGERARFTARYANLNATNQAIADQLGDLDAYQVFHLGGSFKATRNLTLNATLYNLFDKDFLGGDSYTAANGTTGWASHYIQGSAGTSGTLEEGRRLWLSAVMEF